MKTKLLAAAVAALFSGALAAAEHPAATPGMPEADRPAEAREQIPKEPIERADPQKDPQVGVVDDRVKPHLAGVPITEHQFEVVREFLERFDALDEAGDGMITREEAQQLPALAEWMEREGLEEIGRADFARFESEQELGADLYKLEEDAPGGIPVSPHPEEVIRETPLPADPPRPVQ
jgi:hypothetical protein